VKVAQQDLLTGIEPVGNKVGFLVGYNVGSSVRGSVFGLGVGIGRDVGLGVGLVGKRVGARVGMAIKISIGGPNTTPVTVTSAIACRQRALQYLTLPKDAKDGQANTYATKKAYEIYDRDKLALFELKRQRIFRIFQELTAVNHENGDNNNNADSIKFYRADMRPSIPEFFDIGELPLLEGIFGSHPDITHVVHLADDDIKSQNQAIIPRNRDSIKAGRMEGILEEMRLVLERRATADADHSGDEEEKAASAYHLPQLVYASSYEVYDYLSTAEDSEQHHQPNPLPFREDKPITTPSTLHGASKLIDEVLASAYHSTHGIYSVGLRFFPVYGPWSNPGTDVFDLAEQLCSRSIGDDNDEDTINDEKMREDEESRFDEDVKDYVYIDDAVDAIMAAMQYRPPGQDPSPVVFNVGTGQGSTLKQIRDEMMSHFPPNFFDDKSQTIRSSKQRYNIQRQATISYASTEHSKSLLGFEAQVPLSVGIAKTLTWFRKRSFSFGKDSKVSTQQSRIDSFVDKSLANTTREDCSPFDRECLRGETVFPCASECSKTENCTPSSWDDVATLSRLVTSGCDAVMFTILLDEDAEQIPSATAAAASFVGANLPETDEVGKRTRARCNIAFVSEDSPLVQRLRSGELYTDNDLPAMIRHGFWTLLPLKSTPSGWLHAFSGSFALSHLPKISPGKFFGSSVRYAIFVAPSVLIADLPRILKQMDDGPPGKDSALAMMVMESCVARDRKCTCPLTRSGNNDSIQRMMHIMVRVALKGDLIGGGFVPVIDSSFIVHSLQGDDAKMLRCDVYSEAAQWGASSDESSLEFILSLHDFWSRAGNLWSDSGIAETEDSLLGVLSSSETQLFAQILPPDSFITSCSL
jgi:UDP-glucuronate 4-epimerase